MSAFRRLLRDRQPDPGSGRRWLFVAYDQLNDGIGPLAAEPPDELGVVLIESPAKAARRPYHRQKLALVLANLRHFALEQAGRGVAVRHVVAPGGYAEVLGDLAEELGPLRVMRPAERELRAELAPLLRRGALVEVPHDGWLATAADLADSHRNGPPFRMDRFYRHVRRRTGLLMDGDQPRGGKWSFDADNRRPWRGEPPAAVPPQFAADEVKSEVLELVASRFAGHPGVLDAAALPATAADAERAWRWAQQQCLPHFGPYEDAMSAASTTLFHTRISALVNLHRLLPRRVVADAAAMDLPLACQEGFIRQILGWREFVHLVHEATDGFRRLPDGEAVAQASGAADPDHLDARQDLPAAFWGKPSGLRCLDRVVADVWREGYGHHITRLMVLANIATLLGVRPRQLTDWFWCAYTDAYDWVVEPNVLAMGSFAVGDLMTTKPYVSGGAYIGKMSDYCGGCAFDPRRNCPITSLYWEFLGRNRDRLEGNPRLAMPLRAQARRKAAQRRRDAEVAERLRAALAGGEAVDAELLAQV